MAVDVRISILLAGFFVLPPTGWSRPPDSPLEKYRKLKYPPKEENFAKGWKERVVLEFEIINDADLKQLRAALKDNNAFVRSMAARALGIRGDKASADALADLVKTDRESSVRIRAVEALGLLKKKGAVIEQAKKDRSLAVRWVANMAASQLKSATDYAASVRRAYAAGIKREAIGTAAIGQPAPDFTAQTSDGKAFKLSTVLRKKPIAIYFAAYDG